MNYEFDPVKNAININKHQVSLADVEYFEWETAVVKEDSRKRYDESRFVATGYIGERLFVLIYCFRGDAIRAISLRKANMREVNLYAKT